MSNTQRKPIIAGNWKMNMTPSETKALLTALVPLVKDAKCDVVVIPPYVCLETAKAAIAGTNIKLGAQNVHWADKGAFTGEVSADMLKEVGAEYVVIGHSERRQYFGETDETVNLRAHQAYAKGLLPIICVGETLDEREQGKTEAKVSAQTTAALSGFSAEEAKNIIIAYEPIWAIGTGKTATDAQANETVGVIRGCIAKLYDQTTAQAVRIQYGGSMNKNNAVALMAMPEIDGGLIGGASLKAPDFAEVIAAAK